MVTTSERLWEAVASVVDPEIPVLSIVDLGIVRAIDVDGGVVVRITPTYTGCPATDVIANDVRRALAAAGVEDARVEIALSPAWTTDWITSEGRDKLARYGIAPPSPHAPARVDVVGISPLRKAQAIECPHCGSRATRLVSQFGSTACKALMRCDDCLEPFDYFKPH
jgi:ring-1,2-phenylacetyl-CoA epoxidase subunit PaaD